MAKRLSLKEIPAERRAAGFPGQHLVVLPTPLLRALAEDPLLADLHATASGCFSAAEGHYVERPTGIDDVILIRVRRGAGWVAAPQREEVAAGRCVLIPAGLAHAYGADDHDPWSIEWVHFQGRAAAGFAGLFGATDRVALPALPVRIGEELEFSRLYEALEKGYDRDTLLGISAHLRRVLTALHLAQRSVRPTSAQEAVELSLEWMRTHVAERTSLPELARAAGLSVPHFSECFRERTGYPPMEHFLRLRIQRACQLLDTTTLRVGEVAAAVGWEDAFYFSRYFRKITGRSPREYRAVVKS